MTEQGVSWVKPTLDRMDTFWNQMTNTGRVGELGMTAEQMLPQNHQTTFNKTVGSERASQPQATHKPYENSE